MDWFKVDLFETKMFMNILSLFAFIGTRHVIGDLYDNRLELLSNPVLKVIFLFSVIYINLKSIRLSILVFFGYLLFITNYIGNETKAPEPCGVAVDDFTQEKMKVARISGM